MRIAESERTVMTPLWENGSMLAKDLAAELKKKVGWSKTTTYTMIKRCMDKGYISREADVFLCTATLTKAQVADMETDALLENNYDGSADLLVAALVDKKKLTTEQLGKLYRILKEAE